MQGWEMERQRSLFDWIKEKLSHIFGKKPAPSEIVQELGLCNNCPFCNYIVVSPNMSGAYCMRKDKVIGVYTGRRFLGTPDIISPMWCYNYKPIEQKKTAI